MLAWVQSAIVHAHVDPCCPCISTPASLETPISPKASVRNNQEMRNLLGGNRQHGLSMQAPCIP